MKKVIHCIVLICAVLISSTAFGQSKGDVYRRNSLCVEVISPSSTNSSSVTRNLYDAAAEYQVSDKFNDHKIQMPPVDLNSITVSQEEIMSYIKYDQKVFFNKLYSAVVAANNSLAAANGAQGATRPELDEENMVVIKLKKYLKAQKIPALLISKWFNASNNLKDGSYYDMSLIQERGAYNASELDILKAKESVRGMSVLKDAGMDLIPNTYVVLVSLKMETFDEYLNRLRRENQANLAILGVSTSEQKSSSKSSLNEESGLAKRIRGYAAERGIQLKRDNTPSNNLYVTATCYLFKLQWNENVEEIFINKYYGKHPSVLLDSKEFGIVFKGYKTASLMFNEGTTVNNQKADRVKLVKRATIQAIDKCIADLQKAHEDFKVKTPIIDVSEKEVTAFIGYKEGIDGNTKFEVLEKNYNEKKNTYKYKRVGTLKVDPNQIWDNRYTIDGLPMNMEDGMIKSNVNRTHLKGSTKNLAPGMLIRQIK